MPTCLYLALKYSSLMLSYFSVVTTFVYKDKIIESLS